MSELKSLYPNRLWEIFENICSIPHPSGFEADLVKHVKEYGEKLNLKTVIDEVGNVIISKPATPGFENRKGIILQGHLDMVPQKNNDTAHDFEKDSIKAYVDGDWVKAKGTTLGADNGIGAAAALAILGNNEIQHGPLEVLLTIDEETGMTGAFGLKPGLLKGDILMNLDSEDEGELYIGCAGGLDANAEFKIEWDAVKPNSAAYTLVVKGLKGGHSGVDILLQRANANKVLSRVLFELNANFGIQICCMEGGSLRNAIPREAKAVFCVVNEKSTQAEQLINNLAAIIKKEFASVDEGLIIEFTKASSPSKVFSPGFQKTILGALYSCPNGVIRMCDDMKGVVETSNNMAIIKTDDTSLEIKCLMRSSVDSAKDDLANMIKSVFELAGAKVELSGAYPGWKPNVNSPILKAMQESYNKKYGKVPEIKVIHAGLECGLFGGVYPNWDMISFGPTIRFPHSPDEKVNIESVGKFWDFLIETLKNAPVK